MILDTDTVVTQQNKRLVKRYQDVESAVRFALNEIKPLYRYATCRIWLSFNFIKRPRCRITPEVILVFDHVFDPDTVELDIQDIIRQIDDRFQREKVTWEELNIDVYKKRIHKFY